MKHRMGTILCLIFVAALTTASLALASHPTPAVPLNVTVDDFDDTALDPAWSWVREDPTRWSLTDNPGFMRITAQAGEIPEGTYLIHNILLQRAPVGEFIIETQLSFVPTANIQRAGLIIYMDDQNLLMLLKAYCGFPACAGAGLYYDSLENNIGNEENFATNLEVDSLYLRLTRVGTQYTADYSENGSDWTELGVHTTTTAFRPLKVGLVADFVPFGAEEIDADFDYFSLESNQTQTFLPIVLR